MGQYVTFPAIPVPYGMYPMGPPGYAPMPHMAHMGPPYQPDDGEPHGRLDQLLDLLFVHGNAVGFTLLPSDVLEEGTWMAASVVLLMCPVGLKGRGVPAVGTKGR
jgi:hypothetical protein